MSRPRILLLDNYDSFTFNLFDYFLQLKADCQVIRNDQLSLEAVKTMDFDALVLSPGPKTPRESGLLMPLIDYYHDKKPILGICLGHQGLGEYFGAELCKAKMPMHGKTSSIRHDGGSVFEGLPDPLRVMRYHSLVIKVSDQNKNLLVTATTEDGEIMAIRHRKFPLTGVQFHPESILTEKGLDMLKNWLLCLQKPHQQLIIKSPCTRI